MWWSDTIIPHKFTNSASHIWRHFGSKCWTYCICTAFSYVTYKVSSGTLNLCSLTHAFSYNLLHILVLCSRVRVSFRIHRMHQMRTIAFDDPVALASVILPVCMSRGWLYLLVRQIAPLRCSPYYIAVELRARLLTSSVMSLHVNINKQKVVKSKPHFEKKYSIFRAETGVFFCKCLLHKTDRPPTGSVRRKSGHRSKKTFSSRYFNRSLSTF